MGPRAARGLLRCYVSTVPPFAVPVMAAPIKEGAEDECMAGMHGTPEYCAPEVVIWYWHEQGQLAEPPPRCQAG